MVTLEHAIHGLSHCSHDCKMSTNSQCKYNAKNKENWPDNLFSATHIYRHTHNRLTAVRPGLPGYAGTRKNTHALTPILYSSI